MPASSGENRIISFCNSLDAGVDTRINLKRVVNRYYYRPLYYSIAWSYRIDGKWLIVPPIISIFLPSFVKIPIVCDNIGSIFCRSYHFLSLLYDRQSYWVTWTWEYQVYYRWFVNSRCVSETTSTLNRADNERSKRYLYRGFLELDSLKRLTPPRPNVRATSERDKNLNNTRPCSGIFIAAIASANIFAEDTVGLETFTLYLGRGIAEQAANNKNYRIPATRLVMRLRTFVRARSCTRAFNPRAVRIPSLRHLWPRTVSPIRNNAVFLSFLKRLSYPFIFLSFLPAFEFRSVVWNWVHKYLHLRNSFLRLVYSRDV